MGKRRQEVVITHITVAYLFLAFVTSLVIVELTNGKPVVKSNLSNLDNKIDISNLSRGVYVIKLENISIRLIKQ